jgi:tetratricopeptide (TPR) repeat protein
MRKGLFIIIISCLSLISFFSQDIHQIKEYSDIQFGKGNYEIALKEYQRVLLFDSASQYTDIYSKVAQAYYLQHDFNSAIKYYNLAWNIEQNDSIRLEYIFLKSLSHFKLNEFFLALNELLGIPENKSAYFEDKKNLYMGICYYGLNDNPSSFDYFSELLDSTGMQQISSIFADFEKFSKRFNPRKIEIMSYIFPGLGQIYAGDPGSGLNSFVLLSGIAVYGLFTMANYGFLDGFLVLSSWFYRYYTGGAKNAADIAHLKLEKKKSANYLKILQIVERQGTK